MPVIYLSDAQTNMAALKGGRMAGVRQQVVLQASSQVCNADA